MLIGVMVAGSATAVISPAVPTDTELDYAVAPARLSDRPQTGPAVAGTIGEAVAVTDVWLAALPVRVAVYPTPSASSAAAAAGSAGAPTDPQILSAPPRTNLTAVLDPIAVPVHDGFLVRVGVRNSGPRSISAPTGQSAAAFTLTFGASGYLVKSLGGCDYVPEMPPDLGPPISHGRPAYFACHSGRTLRVNQTYWQSFVFPHLDGFRYGVWLAVTGYAEDPEPGDDSRDVVVRVARPGEALPVTGTTPISVASVGFMLIIVGALAIRYGRHRRRTVSRTPRA
jgi:hypothetical protein